MTLSDDLKTDLQSVFFADFNDVAVIKNTKVVGFLDINAYQWADVDTNQHIFITSLPQNVILKRDDSLTISGAAYKYVTKRQKGDLTYIIIRPS